MHMHGKQNVTVHTPRAPSTSLAPSLLRSCSTLSHPTSLTDQSQQSTSSYFQLYTVIRPSLRLVINIVCSSQCTHLATELLAEQDVPCCQVPVDEPSPWEVPHTLSNLLAEGQQLLWQTFFNNGPRAGWGEHHTRSVKMQQYRVDTMNLVSNASFNQLYTPMCIQVWSSE